MALENELKRLKRLKEMELLMELQKTVPQEELQKMNNKEENIITPNPDDWEDKLWLR